MLDWILRWVISAVALAIVAQIPLLEISYSNDPWVLIRATIFIGLVNSLVRPILLFLNRPLNCLTLGLSAFCINALLFAATQWFVPGFRLGLRGAFFGPVLMSLVGGLLSTFVGARKKG
jgi:putative membrane protein